MKTPDFFFLFYIMTTHIMDQELYIADIFKVNFKIHVCSNNDDLLQIHFISSFFHLNSIIMPVF